MKSTRKKAWLLAGVGSLFGCAALSVAQSQEVAPRGKTSYAPVAATDRFEDVVQRMSSAKPEVVRRHKSLLEERYDLGDHPVGGLTMSRGKAVQGGVRVKLPAGLTWEKLASMPPAEIREKNLWPAGFYPLPHPNHPEG